MQAACGAVDATLLEFDDLTPLDQWIPALSRMLNESRAPSRPIVESSSALVRALLVRNPGSAQIDEWLTKAERAAPPSARMSSQLTWFDTNSTSRRSRVPVVRMRSPAIHPTALRKAMTIGEGRPTAR